MKRFFLRLVVYVCLVAVFVGGIGWFGFHRSREAFYEPVRKEPLPSLHGVKKPEYHPNKPTVAVLLGNEATYGSDFMIPYVSELDRIIVPGREAIPLAAEEMKNWNEKGKSNEVLFIHSDSPDKYMLEVEFEDLAMQEDLLTAKHAVKRLEFRGDDIHLEGKPFPLEPYGHILLTSLLALLLAFCIDRRLIMKI